MRLIHMRDQAEPEDSFPKYDEIMDKYTNIPENDCDDDSVSDLDPIF